MKTKFNGILTLLLALVVQISFAQDRTISGTVSDESGPLPGVTVLRKGTAKGTETDFDGKYTITTKQGEVLIFSFVGMKTAQKTVGASNSLNLVMQNDNVLDEIVVTALGIKRKSDEITTANQVVKASEITKAEVPTVTQGLVGKVSGLQINTTSQGAKPTFDLRLRGNRSLTGNNSALIVIDGAISSSVVLNALDPKSIESVNVIKGANGAALYGSDGSNGVLIVTTKKGNNDGKFRVTIGTSVQVQELAYLPERQTTYGQGWGTGINLGENGAWGPAFDGSIQPVGVAAPGFEQMYAPYVGDADNIKNFFKKGFQKQYNIGLSTGNLEQGYVNFSAGLLDVTSIIPNEKYKRSSFNFKAGKKVGKLTVDGSISYIVDSEKVASSETTRGDNSVYGALLQTPTNVNLDQFKDFTGNERNTRHWNSYYLSPYWVLDNVRSTTKSDIVNTTINLGYEINDNINFTVLGNAIFRQTNTEHKRNAFTEPVVQVGDRTSSSRYTTRNRTTREIYSNYKFNFDYDLTEDITFKANVGGDIREFNRKYLYSGVNNLAIESLSNIASGASAPTVTDAKYKRRAIGLFGNFDFGFRDYLFLNMTARNDWTSKLSKDNNSFFYPSAGVSFVPTKAFPSLKTNVLNKMKLSYSFVKVGNDAAGINAINAIYEKPAAFPYGDLTSFRPDRTITDPNLTPEFIASHEFGLNVDLYRSRVTLDFSAFTSKNTDQVVKVASSRASGVEEAGINIGETSSQGFEVDLGFVPIKTDDLRWDLRVSYATNKTVVDKISDSLDEVVISDDTDFDIVAKKGEEFPLIKGIAYQRDDKGRVIVDASTGNPLQTDAKVVLGKVTPDYVLGLTSALNYKGFTLSTTLDYRTGHSIYSSVKKELTRSGYTVETVQSGRKGFILPNSVISDGKGGYVPNTNVITGGTTSNSITNYYTGNFGDSAENFVLDATALKVREISLTYDMPKDFLKNTGVNSLQIGLSARNPFVLLSNDNRGFTDPEYNSVGGDTSKAGDSFNNAGGASRYDLLPPTRYYGLSVNLSL
ncbi:SusC/RagA family TonB-linked outer membrane protein [Tenacibaculum piscium]|uniref:SusC/RagA family TonB-linked outer membrane protein n=1 Tax=Tenacibaculum piscium TaxID=1458515 RepID=UPI001EFB40A6|nr:SusC/RagA family TonB-linked outer membrane protein [Tenacibaculum piscium]MCG8183755.1 SusC/RagA family TonB-linked outer membrane protein [Tenacibaculum piscium]MCG8205319.1 SusC/RagA family TonB-linked outer membrane protein [Tenacibaculum piscium]